jgi:hypothetical protein
MTTLLVLPDLKDDNTHDYYFVCIVLPNGKEYNRRGFLSQEAATEWAIKWAADRNVSTDIK